MKKFLLTLPLIIIIFSFLVAPYALADCMCSCNDGYSPSSNPVRDNQECENICIARPQGIPYTCSPVGGQNTNTAGGPVSIKDPIHLGSLEDLYARIITAILGFVGVASLITFVYAGFMFLVSTGNPERVKKAKDTMFYSVIGVIIAIASYAILSFIFKTLETATGQ